MKYKNIMSIKKVAIIGAGNMGLALANGLVRSKKYKAEEIIITRRNASALTALSKRGFCVSTDNALAVQGVEMVILAILPQQLNDVLKQLAPVLDEKKQLLVSVLAGISCEHIKTLLQKNPTVVRVMPNTAISIGQSMTCITSDYASEENIKKVKDLFNTVGICIDIKENLMPAATALCACGIAFYMRAIRAATEAGVELGFHSHEALEMTLQTVKGAVELLQKNHSNPETEIDKVTSPGGYTIKGLNELEHNGFSSALIKGIKAATHKNN